MRHYSNLFLFLLVLVLCKPILGQDSATAKVDFAKHILPVFQSKCVSCHGPTRQESNYRLDVKSLAFGEGDFGEPPIQPGDAKNSPLFQFVSGHGDVLMPPKDSGVSISPDELASIKDWIDQGAIWPDEFANEDGKELTTDHWSFQPISRPQLPLTDKNLFEQNEIDKFVLRKLVEIDIPPAARADRKTLLRRLYLVMHGLQPTAEQIEEFEKDRSDDAWEKQIEKVLSSHHYGERWARHWLDVVRFGESTGYEVNRDRANAWHYRDYVIDAFNKDKSYRDFVIEQLAGDSVGADEATGFLVGGPNDIVKSPDINLTLMQREDELADYVNTTSTTFLGLTVGCARCHNHKFDPILQRDYYAIQAVFSGVQHGERKMVSKAPPATQAKIAVHRADLAAKKKEWASFKSAHTAPHAEDPNLIEMVNAKQNTDSFDATSAKFVRFNVLATNSVEPCIDELEVYSVNGINVGLASLNAKPSSSGDYAGNPKHKLQHINDGKFGNNHSWISNTNGTGWVQLELNEPHKIERVVWGRDREEVYSDRLAVAYEIQVSLDGAQWRTVAGSHLRKPFQVGGVEPDTVFVSRLQEPEKSKANEILLSLHQLQTELIQLEQTIPLGYVGNFGNAKPVFRLHRGDPLSPKEEVGPDTISILGSLELLSTSTERERRLKFAKWVASPENPLTARVIVNRVWQFHFGNGLVTTPSDLGEAGTKPTHPELLDWLATEFMNNGWSLKWLHRKILTSATWQQSSSPSQSAIAKDAGCQTLWRFPPRRLEAEAIRDCILQLSGKLNLSKGGPGFLLFEIDRENVHHYFPLENFTDEHFRRMIYMTKIRQEQDDVFGVFDCPDGGQTIPTRSRSTTALQALNLLNSKFMLEQADFLAERIKTLAGDDLDAQIKAAYRLAYLREPTQSERDDVAQFVQRHDLQAFCRVLLNTNEFLFLD